MDVPVSDHRTENPMTVEYDQPFLFDSGTESFTESPIADEESEPSSEDSTVCDFSEYLITLSVLTKI